MVEQDTRDETRAELSYDRSGDQFSRSYRDFTLRIYDAGELVFERELTCGRALLAGRLRAKARRSRCATSTAAGPRCSSTSTRAAPTAAGSRSCTARTATRTRGARRTGGRSVRGSRTWAAATRSSSRTTTGFLGPYGCASCWRYLPHVWRFDDGELPRRHAPLPGAGPARLEEAAAQVLPRERERRRRQAGAGRLRRDAVPPGSARVRAGASCGARCAAASSTTGAAGTTSARAGIAIRSGCGASCARPATARSAAPRRYRPSPRGRRGGGR